MRPVLARLALSVLLAAAVAPAAAESPSSSPVLATVAGSAITVEDLEREMVRRGGRDPAAFATLEQRRALLEEMVRERALVAAARAAGYAEDPEVVAVTERMMVSRLRQDRLDPRLAELAVSDDEVAAYYRVHHADYAEPERVRAAMVFIAVHPNATDEVRAERERLAETVLEEAMALPAATLHFGPVARAYSDDRASRYQGGVIGWLTQHPGHSYRWEPEVVEAIFALEREGEIGPLVRTAKGLYLVRLVERQGSSARPLDRVADGIRQRLLRERRERLEQEFLRQVTGLVASSIDESVLASLALPAGPSGSETRQPPPLPAD